MRDTPGRITRRVVTASATPPSGRPPTGSATPGRITGSPRGIAYLSNVVHRVVPMTREVYRRNHGRSRCASNPNANRERFWRSGSRTRAPLSTALGTRGYRAGGRHSAVRTHTRARRDTTGPRHLSELPAIHGYVRALYNLCIGTLNKSKRVRSRSDISPSRLCEALSGKACGPNICSRPRLPSPQLNAKVAIACRTHRFAASHFDANV